MSSTPPASTYSKEHPFPARVTENRLLSGATSAKETRHFVVDLADSGLTYEAGDSLGICPTNRAEDVNTLLQKIGATGDELVSPAMLKLPAPAPLRTVLATGLALAGPTPKLLQTLAAKATAEAEKERLAHLFAPENKEEQTAFLVGHTFAELLAEFPSARLTAQELVDHMRKLMPRLYSIASSPRLHPREVHLTVAIVRYRLNGKPRIGVCSTFLADRVEVGSSAVPVFVSHSHFRPPEDFSRDVIMIGPGTGIAPFRAFVQERAASGATGRNWVFFGDQHRATDFLYEEEWKQHLAAGTVTRLDLAFSRDQEQKIYVQDRMRENAAELWAWLQGGASLYVCGDAKRMAKDVDAALHEIIERHGHLDAAAAVDYVKQLKKDKRYQRDVY